MVEYSECGRHERMLRVSEIRETRCTERSGEGAGEEYKRQKGGREKKERRKNEREKRKKTRGKKKKTRGKKTRGKKNEGEKTRLCG